MSHVVDGFSPDTRLLKFLFNHTTLFPRPKVSEHCENPVITLHNQQANHSHPGWSVKETPIRSLTGEGTGLSLANVLQEKKIL